MSTPATVASAPRNGSPSPVSAAGTCRLPIADISEAHGWFITYPGGQRQDDPSSVVALPGGTPGQVGANPGLTYDHLAATWVPVPSWWVAPGGQLYAYWDPNGIRSVTIPDGVVAVVATGGGWYLIDTEDAGVYVIKPSKPGAWFIPFGGQARQVVDHGTWQRFFAGALWGIDQSGNLVRHDVRTGREATWATFAGYAEIAGFSQQGDPAISHSPSIPSDDANQPYDLVLVHPPTPNSNVWSGKGSRTGVGAVGDAHGLWFEVGGGLSGASGHGVYLWTATQGAQLVTSTEGHLAGGCW